MLDIMYELPSLDEVNECIITEDSVLKKSSPILYREDGTQLDLDHEKKRPDNWRNKADSDDANHSLIGCRLFPPYTN